MFAANYVAQVKVGLQSLSVFGRLTGPTMPRMGFVIAAARWPQRRGHWVLPAGNETVSASQQNSA